MENVPYIVHTRFKDKAICGEVNLPYGTRCTMTENLISYNKKPICYTTSENAHNHFSRDDDNNGTLRGKMIKKLQKTLEKRDANYQSRWDIIWDNCKGYQRVEHQDHWLWNQSFFDAPIEELTKIMNLLGIKGE